MEKKIQGKKHSRKLLVLDFDNTLFFTERAIHMAAKDVFGEELTLEDMYKMEAAVKKPLFEHANTKYKEYLEPNGRLIGLSEDLRLKGYEVIVLSGRHEGHLENTRYSLDLHGVKYKKIILSPKGRTTSDYEWKSKALSPYVSHYNEIIFFDDKMENIEYIKKAFSKRKIRFFLVDREGEKEIK